MKREYTEKERLIINYVISEMFAGWDEGTWDRLHYAELDPEIDDVYELYQDHEAKDISRMALGTLEQLKDLISEYNKL